MNSSLDEYLKKNDYEKITRDLIAWIRDWFSTNGPDSPAVIGISGGKDSSVVAALCKEALGKDRVFGIMMPNGVQPDIEVSHDLVNFLGIRHAQIDVSMGIEGVKQSLIASNITPSTQTNINLPPRIRMATLYAVSQTVNGRVSNNCNRSENYVGYSTIFGDAAGDFSPLSNLTVTEVIKIGECMKMPKEFIYKAPSDGLTDRTDEDNFGFTYEDLDTYILTGVCPDLRIKELIDRRHAANLFKMRTMPSFKF